MDLGEVVNLPCKDCGREIPVNVVYLPYLGSQLPCREDNKCPLKNDKNL